MVTSLGFKGVKGSGLLLTFLFGFFIFKFRLVRSGSFLTRLFTAEKHEGKVWSSINLKKAGEIV